MSADFPARTPGVARIADASPRVKSHRRFALANVTLGGLPVGGATVDAWSDGTQTQRWSARLLMPIAHPHRGGILAGTALGGLRMSGVVRLFETENGPRRGREVLAEFHGEGPLHIEAPVA